MVTVRCVCTCALCLCLHTYTCVWYLLCIVAVRKSGFEVTGDLDNLALKHGVYSGSRTTSTDLGYRGSSTTITSKATSQRSKVCNASPINHMQSLVTTHQDVTCASYFPTMQIPSLSAGEEPGPLREPDTTTLKGEHRVTNGAQRWAESTIHNPPLQLLRQLWMSSAGSLLASSHSRLDQKEGSCVWSPQMVLLKGRWEGPSS